MNMGNFSRRCSKVIRNVGVEPMILFTFLSLHIMQVVQQVGIYRVVCLQTFAAHPEINCSRLRNATIDGELAENIVQKKVTMWGMALGLSYMVPALFADTILGACGDRYGRKVNMMLGMAGTMLSMYPLILLYTFPLIVPLYFLVIVHVISGFTGFVSIVLISAMAYLADTILDAADLTVRMSIVSVFSTAASIVGPLLVGVTTKSLTQSQLILVCEVFLTIAFIYCVCRIRQIPPAQLRRLLQEKRDRKEGKTSQLEQTELKAVKAPTTAKTPAGKWGLAVGQGEGGNKFTWALPFELLKDTWRTYTKPREGNVRLYLLCASFVFFLNVVSELGLRVTIFMLYVQKAPLSWDQDTIGYFKAAQATMHLAGTVFGVLIFKKCLRFTDTAIVLIASSSHVLETMVMAFATETWVVYVSAAAGVFSGLMGPCMQSFVAKQVGAAEVGKAYTAFGISASIGFIISSAIYNPIYYATLSFFPGFVFIFASILLACALLVVAWLHFDLHFKGQFLDDHFGKRLIRSIFHDETCGATEVADTVPQGGAAVAQEKLEEMEHAA